MGASPEIEFVDVVTEQETSDVDDIFGLLADPFCSTSRLEDIFGSQFGSDVYQLHRKLCRNVRLQIECKVMCTIGYTCNRETCDILRRVHVIYRGGYICGCDGACVTWWVDIATVATIV